MRREIIVRCIMGAAVVLALSVCQEASAQGRRGGRGMMFGMAQGVSPLNTVGIPAVQKELGLEGAKTDKVKSLLADYREELQKEREAAGLSGRLGRDASTEERQKRMEQMAEVQKKVEGTFGPKLNVILDKTQQTRLSEIATQVAGVHALQDAAVVKQLGLTKEQQDKIAAVTKEHGGHGSGQGGAAGFAQRREEQLAKATEVLTKDQQAQFVKMTGKPFDVSQIFQGRRGGGRQRDNN